MHTTTISGQEFNRDASGARRAAKSGPVIITDRGRPAHVLLEIEQYQQLIGGRKSIAELLAMPGGRAHRFRARAHLAPIPTSGLELISTHVPA
jgi:prevent-host-death family protein